MTKTNQDFTVYQGDQYEVTVPVEIDDPNFSLQDGDVRWEVARSSDVEEVMLSKDDAGALVIDQDSNEFTFTLTGDDTDLYPRSYYHQAILTTPDGSESTLLTGQVLVRDRI